MRYIYIYIILFGLIKKQVGQNFVPNSSFETYTTCPNGDINNLSNWIGTIGTPDCYNTCSPSTSIPANFSGYNYQMPRTGNTYVGIQTVVTFVDNIRENFSTQLISPLINGNYYLTKFYTTNVQCYKVANNNLALNFSNTLTYTVASGSTVNLPMHIYKFGNPVITDTLNWTEIMGIYKANGTEQYITIGNFKDDANTKIDTTNYGILGYAAYYMIDDVSVEPICAPFWSYSDTTVTVGDSVLIGPAITGLNINWYDASNTLISNAPGIYVKPTQTTTYTAVEDFCGTTYTNNIVVTVLPTGVKEYNELVNSFNFYPNPTIDKITISSTKFKIEGLKIAIVDLLGKKVFLEVLETETNSKTFNLKNLDNGIYFIQLYSSNQLLITKKIEKQ